MKIPRIARMGTGTLRGLKLAAAGVCALSLGLQSLPGSAAQTAATAWVEGRVVSHETGAPVSGATVVLPDYGVSTTSGRGGAFRFPGPLEAERPYRRITARVTAPGFGDWTVTGLPLRPDDTLRLFAELRPTEFHHRVLSPEERSPARHQASPTGPTGNTCSGWVYQLVPPPKIKVFISDEGASREYDFVFYVTHVLPSEWIPSWDADALGAGAIAARTYAHYRTMPDHAYSGGPGCADVIDTVADQIFDPTYSHAATDQAVYATFGSILYKGPGIFLSQYYAGYPGQPCAPVEGEFEGRMSQWGTQTCALNGKVWPGITTTFYVASYWRYLQNLLLNPSASSDALYAWRGGSGTNFARTAGVGYEGGWFFKQWPKTEGGNSTLYQDRPFNGGTTTKYHAEVALACPTQNDSSCTVSIGVVAFQPSGGTVTRSKSVTLPPDGKWRLYTFDPAAHGKTHNRIRLRTGTYETIYVDWTVLNGPFGGP
jgi:hypothetical protein